MNRNLNFRSLLPAILWFAFMSMLLFMPGKDLPSSGWVSRFHLDKLGHFILFFVLVIFFSVPILKSALTDKLKSRTILVFAVAAVIWGISTEFIQGYFIPGRDFSLLDWAADVAGVLVGYFLLQSIKSSF